MSDYAFHGTERVTLEIDGTFDPARLGMAGLPPFPSRLRLDLVGDRARVRLFAFHVDELKITGVPFVKVSYAEVLWRVAVLDGDTPSWWVCACDLEHLGARVAATRFVRYPVRSIGVAVTAEHIAVRGDEGELSLAIGLPGAERAEVEQRPLLVGDDASFIVPWGDDGGGALPATVRVEVDSLSMMTLGSAVSWAPVALVRTGREHRCGVAKPRDSSSGPP